MRGWRTDRGGRRLTGPSAPPFTIRPFQGGDEAALVQVEHRASALLDGYGLHTAAPPTTAEDLATFLHGHTVLVAVRDGTPVGFAAGTDLGELYWLREIAVDPAHGRGGIGRALVKGMGDEARALFHRAIGLTTYRDVPFNAPFYSRCGFLTVSQQPPGSIFAQRLAFETPPGAARASRTAMVRWL